MSQDRSAEEIISGARAPGATIGILEWFRPGEYEQVERVLADLQIFQVKELRTGISWADYYNQGGEEWFGWLIPRLAREVRLLPCVHYTPPSLGLAPKVSSPPRFPKQYADFLDVLITRFEDHFEYVELWNEPNNLNDWDWRLDPEWHIFAEMAGGAAYWAQKRGKKTVLAGMCPVDGNWLRLMFERGVMNYIDVVGIHGFPGTWEFDWNDWSVNVNKIREVLNQYQSSAEIWITETGYSTWRHDEHKQVQAFIRAIDAAVKRVYWYSAYDLHPDLPHVDAFHGDERHYHFGLKKADSTPKLLYRQWAEGGLEKVRETARFNEPHCRVRHLERPYLITGGAGFIGTNLAHRLLSQGQTVLLYDNLSRPGVEKNLGWLRETHGDRVQIEVADIRDIFSLRQAVRRAKTIFHLAAQVAVTSSLIDPLCDFEINVRGTLNILDVMRAMRRPPSLLFTSTNKVYGSLPDVKLTRNGTRYEPDEDFCGIGENRPLDFHSPYGCSKGAADQYILDHARIFGLPAVVFRMSCIYGPHQMGREDQGWVAHFLIRALRDQPITLYGDGFQVRDVLFVEDLIDALLLAHENMDQLSGHAFNIGGGLEKTLSLLELINRLEEMLGQKITVRYAEPRPGDQLYYVSDFGKFQNMIGWSPVTHPDQGLERLHQWLVDSGVAAFASKVINQSRA